MRIYLWPTLKKMTMVIEKNDKNPSLTNDNQSIKGPLPVFGAPGYLRYANAVYQ